MNQNALDAQQFDWNRIKYGVPKGQRHTTLVEYFNWLIDQYYSRDEVIDILMCWNRKNRPPMHPEEVMAIIYDLWEQRPTQDFRSLTPNEISAMLAEKESIGIGSWFLEPEIPGCYRFMAVLHAGSQYKSVYLPCRPVVGWIPSRKIGGSEAKIAVRTWLPLYRQKDVAARLGATICDLFEWQFPKDVPQREWENRFVEAIQHEEQAIEDKLSKLSTLDSAQTRHELYVLDSYPELFEGYFGQI